MEHELFTPLADTLPGLIWVARPDGRGEYLNQRWQEYTGLRLDQAIGVGWKSAIHPEDLALVLERWPSFQDSGKPRQVEARIRRHDGEYRRFLFSAAPVTDSSGGVVKWCGINTDIEDRLRAEEAVQRERETRGNGGQAFGRRDLDLRLIVDSIPVPVAVTSPTGEVEALNQPTLDYFGKTFEELKGWKASDVVHPDDLQRTIATQMAAHQAGHSYNVESRHRRADGVYRWFNVLGLPLRDLQGRILCWFILQIDIDDRKRAEAALRESERALRSAIDGIPGFVGILAPNGDVEAFNRQILEYSGQTLEELKNWRTNGMFHDEDLPNVAEVRMRSILSGVPYKYEARLRRHDGEYRWFDVRGIPDHDSSGRIARWYVLLTDIEDRKRAEGALNVARAELAHAARVMTLGALTASIAHEVNQPLSGIITNASTCLRMLGVDPPNLEGARATAQRTLRDGNRASEIIQRLRAMFAHKEPTAEPVDLNEAAREVLALSSSELQRRGVTLRTDFYDGLPAITGDRVQLQQVILNLVLNAADAMRTVEDRPRNLLVATTNEDGKRVRLSVRDSGSGISSKDAEKLFQAFYTTKSNGMGVGLSISRSIIDSHRGRLWATANDGPGATFSFAIPSRSEPAPVTASSIG